MIAQYRKFRALSRSERRLLLEAAALIAIASSALRFLSLASVARILKRYAGPQVTRGAFDDGVATVDAVHWAVTAMARRFQPARCLAQALAADAMLRRRGVACELRIGVRLRREATVRFESHAWVECRDKVAIGALDDLSAFTVVLPLKTEPPA